MFDGAAPPQTLSDIAAREEWEHVLDRVQYGHARIVVQRHGVPVAAIVAPEDLERLDRYDADRARDFAVLDEVGQAFKGVSPDEIDREVAATVAAVRAEMRQERGAPNQP